MGDGVAVGDGVLVGDGVAVGGSVFVPIAKTCSVPLFVAAGNVMLTTDLLPFVCRATCV